MRRAWWLVVPVFLIVYLTLGFVTFTLYQRRAPSSRWEGPLVFAVFYPVWVICDAPWKSEFMGFQYRLETKSGGALTRHDVILSMDTNGVVGAPVLSSCVTRWTRASLEGSEPYQVTEAEVRLTRQQAKAVEHAIRSWKGGRKDFHDVDDLPPDWEGKHPVVLFQAYIRAEDSLTGHQDWRGYQIEAFGPVECSAARRLIQSINQALPASVRKNHALTLPPDGRSN